jgi:long-chain acyl-CoA synthetase
MENTLLIHMFWSRVFNHPDETAMLVSLPAPPKKTLFGTVKKSAPTAVTWKTSGLAVHCLMRMLTAEGVKKGDRVAILGWNSAEWLWTDLALQTLGAISVPIYPNLSSDQVADILKDAGATLAVTADSEQVKKLAGPDGRPVVPYLMLGGKYAFVGRVLLASIFPLLASVPVNEKRMVADISALFEMINRGSGCFGGLNADDTASIIYTSGSSGTPKGCMITHGNVAAEMKALAAAGLARESSDMYLSYLPMAHVYERFNGMAFAIWNGVPVAFCAVDEVKKGLAMYKPTMICGVPAVWRKIRESIVNPEDGPLKKLDDYGLWKPLRDWAFATKKGSWQHKLADIVLFKRIRAKLGGALNLAVSGGAPIPAEVLDFFDLLGIQILEGYGLSETTGGIAIHRIVEPGGEPNKRGSVGKVLPGLDVRIVLDEGETEVGEIQLRGPMIFKGYWNKPEETAASRTNDGWFRTGDNGRLDADGNLFIIGRRNGQYKTEGGKFVGKETIEKAFEVHPIVHFVVPVAHGRKYATALIFVNHINARKLINRPIPQGVDPAVYLIEQPEVVAAVNAAVSAANDKLQRWEQVKKFKVMPVEASVANGLLTPTLKMRTKEAFTRFATEIESLYAPTK